MCREPMAKTVGDADANTAVIKKSIALSHV
jgi:hypothetical protein